MDNTIKEVVFTQGAVNAYKNVKLTGDLQNDIRLFKNIFSGDSVFKCREINSGGTGFAVMFLDGMVNNAIISEAIVKPLALMRGGNGAAVNARYISQSVIFGSEVSYKTDVADMISTVLCGDTLVLISGSKTALGVNTKGFCTRSVEEPADERVTQGPREGFIENAMYNLSLIRRKLLTPDLKVKPVKLGRRSDTSVYVCYLDSLVDKSILDTLYARLEKIDIDGVLDSNYLTEYIRDSKTSIFKTVGTTERPDVVAARILEGRVAVIVDGTPMVLTLPYLFSENFQSDEDYYLSYIVSSVRRLLRYICFVASVSVPAVFIALCTFHIELLPTRFAISVAMLRSGVPISSVGECLLLVIVFEVLKEAGVRMSQSLGHALSIVGGLVVGQAAVEARIISAPMLIAVAFSGICGLMVPRLKTSVLYIRVISVIVCSLSGLYGFMALGAVVVIHVLNLKSFGVDYTISLSRIGAPSLKDTLFRAPWPKMLYRPLFNKNLRRTGGKRG